MKKNIYFYSNLVAWGLVLFLISNYVFGWTTPSQDPPGGNVTLSPSQWTTSGSDIYYNDGNVGIGTSTPNNLFQVYDYIDFNPTDINTKIGYQAGKNIVSGAIRNTFVGYGAGTSSLTGSTNAADYNTAIGCFSFYSNTTGSCNTTIGYNSLYSNTTGSQNSALGYYSLYSNTTGSQNSAMGYYSLYFNTTGTYNTAMGHYSLYSNTTGSKNSAMGPRSLYLNTTGTYNTAMGYYSLFYNATGTYNTAMGYYALYGNTTGSRNSAFGTEAGCYDASGSNNATSTNSVYLGESTKALASGDTNEIVIGYGAIGVGSNSVVLGNDSITKTILKGNVGIGTTSPSEKLHVVGNIYKTGTVSFVEDYPNDPSKQIVYISLEGPEAGTYIRGTADCENNEAVIIFPDHFRLVTSENGVTAQLTPRLQPMDLFIKELNNEKLIVGCNTNGTFDYFVNGIRHGYENYQVIQEK